MTSTQLIIIIAVIAVVVLALAAAGGGGPRITQITRTVKRDDKKDGDDA